jgi:hypothetical protein
MSLKDSLLRDAKTLLIDVNTFGEQVVYYPHVGYGESPTSRTINAVVIRNQIVTLDADGGESVVPVFEVYVANDATSGISAAELDTGGDQISLAVREGKTPERRSIVHLVNQDHGCLQLQCH